MVLPFRLLQQKALPHKKISNTMCDMINANFVFQNPDINQHSKSCCNASVRSGHFVQIAVIRASAAKAR
jgi:hypothetical protein